MDGPVLQPCAGALPRENVIEGRPGRFAGAWRHIGIYGYRVRSLLEFAARPPTYLEALKNWNSYARSSTA